MLRLQMPYKDTIPKLRIGDTLYLSGELLVLRDAAHQKIFEILRNGGAMPFDIKDRLIYYMGPCPPKDGYAIGSAGPTTSHRMDSYTPALMDMGLLGTIGKGSRSKEVVHAIKRNQGIYLSAIGGAGAYYSTTIKEAKVIAFPELLSEAVRLIRVENFPAVVAIDSLGNELNSNEIGKGGK